MSTYKSLGANRSAHINTHMNLGAQTSAHACLGAHASAHTRTHTRFRAHTSTHMSTLTNPGAHTSAHISARMCVFLPWEPTSIQNIMLNMNWFKKGFFFLNNTTLCFRL